MSNSTKNIILALFIFLLPPIAILYLIFSKSKLWDNPWVKTISLSWCLVFILFAFFAPHQEQTANNKQTAESNQTKTESESNTKTEIIDDAENTDGNNVKTAGTDNTPTATQTPAATTEPAPEPPTPNTPEAAPTATPTPGPTPTPAPTAPRTNQEDPNLPLKAICSDGAVQYQDTPSRPNYQGMCSHHGGIAQKLGRIP